MNEELIHKIGRILAISPSQVEDMTFVEIIGSLVKQFDLPKGREVGPHSPKRKALWKRYQAMSVVSYRTFIRRIEVQGMSPEKAATTPPAPTRPYDKERK
jgi:hypothetical protein